MSDTSTPQAEKSEQHTFLEQRIAEGQQAHAQAIDQIGHWSKRAAFHEGRLSAWQEELATLVATETRERFEAEERAKAEGQTKEPDAPPA